MSIENQKIGYCRPPTHSRWQKGQSGNPKGRRSSRPKSVTQMVEAEFSKLVFVTENGSRKRVTYFEAIVLQLWMKVTTGNSTALRILNKYREFAEQKPEYRFMSAEDTALAAEAYGASRNSPPVYNPSDHRYPILPGMTAKEASEAYRLTLEMYRHER